MKKGYSILFLVGFAAGAVGLYFLARTPEKRMPAVAERPKILKLLAKPFKDENFRKLITFTTMPEKHFLTVPLLILIHIVMGLSSAGVSLASGNISLKLAPEGQATAYLATNTIVNSIAAGIAPILGGKFANIFAVAQNKRE